MTDVSAEGMPQEAFVREALEAGLAAGLAEPTAVTVLKESHRKSLVLRLGAVGPGGLRVVAKRCPAAVADVESTVYRYVLPTLPVRTPKFLGRSAGSGGRAWLFLEDVGDVPWQPDDVGHRVLAARWLGSAHVAACRRVTELDLPARDAQYYAGLVPLARAVLKDALANEAIDGAGRGLLEDLLRRCDGLEERWDAVESILETFPTTLALPGFGAKNVRVLDDALVPFDFENAGWGVPAVELRQVDLDVYFGLVSNDWAVSRAQIETLGALGAGLASLKSIPGEASTLSSPWPRRALEKLGFYAGELVSAEESVRRSIGGVAILNTRAGAP